MHCCTWKAREMTDPAVEAAQRACSCAGTVHSSRCLAAAAREALKPIQAKYKELDGLFGDSPTNVAIGVRRVLQDLAPLIYTTEELT